MDHLGFDLLVRARPGVLSVVASMSRADAGCSCPRVRSQTRGGHGKVVAMHTYACLRERRGDRTMDEYYGVAAALPPMVVPLLGSDEHYGVVPLRPATAPTYARGTWRPPVAPDPGARSHHR